MSKKKLYAVYGTLKKQYGNHRILGDSKLLGTTKTSPDFTMYHLGGFPGVVEKGTTPIEIEVYEVSDPKIEQSLDWLEGYTKGDTEGNHYNKIKIKTEFGKAFIYTYNRDPSQRVVIESGIF